MSFNFMAAITICSDFGAHPPKKSDTVSPEIGRASCRERVKTVSDSFFWGVGSKITADGACSYEIKRCLLLGRKVMTNLDSILKSRDITLPTKIHLEKAMVFPVVIYGCESWTVKKAER